MIRGSRPLLVAAVIALAGAAPWLVSSQAVVPLHIGGSDAAVAAADGPEAVLVATPRQSGSDSTAPRPYAIGIAVTTVAITLLFGGLLVRRTFGRAHRRARWTPCGVRAPPAFRFV